MSDTEVVYTGRMLPMCDIHLHDKGIANVVAAYDGKTLRGPWAYMCEECFAQNGTGLGLGCGQRLILST